MAKTKTKRIKIADIELCPALQARTAIKEATVQEYAQAMQSGSDFPPIIVMPVPDRSTPFCMIDGWHRIKAARVCGHEDIEAIVLQEGKQSDAMWIAASVNANHGMRRTNADKARAVTLAINARPDATYAQIAMQCGVSESMVAAYHNAIAETEAATEVDAVADEDDTPADVDTELSTVQAKMLQASQLIDTIVERLRKDHQLACELAEFPEGAYINAQSVSSDLLNAINGLLHAAPHKECPLCAGAGCETCRMLGWVSKKQWQLIPAAMRGR